MQHIIPAMIPRDLSALRVELEKVRPFAREVQVDIVDGAFVPFASWPYEPPGEISDIGALLDGFSVEFDLMIKQPEDSIDGWLSLSPARVIIHLEGTWDYAGLVRKARRAGVEVGASIGNDTPLTTLIALIDMGRVDHVQLMGIAEIGTQGQPFDERVIARARELKNRYPLLPLSVDGSVNRETIVRLKEAGIDRFAAGSAILEADDPEAAYDELEQLARS